jgi:quercetin dioxygenase-like cupin family protein
MAFKNKEIYNSKTGQGIKFLQTRADTNGEVLEMESFYNSFSKEPPAHYHPYQVEDFIVLEGELTVKVNGQLKILKQGDTLHIEPNVVHAMWNNSENKTIVNWKVQPALDTEYLLETTTALAEDNKTDENGRPPILQIAVMMHVFSDVFRLARPSYTILKIVFAMITPLSYLFGYRATYQKYLN